MKIAIPVKMNKENPPIAPLFGKAKWFAIVENNTVSIVPNNNLGGKAVVDWLYDMQINTILIQEIGLSPYEKIKSYKNINLYHVGFERILLNDALKKLTDNLLKPLNDTSINTVVKFHKKKH